MKVALPEVGYKQSTMVVERAAYNISDDPEIRAHLARVLTKDFYEEPLTSMIRELWTNAADAVRRAGLNLLDFPVGITVPTSSDPYFRVKDRGTGLSREELKHFYSVLGASQSRGLESTTGMLGLGAKSPLAYAQSFTVTAVKDGIKTMATVSTDTTDLGGLDILPSVEVDEPNGVEVEVPVRISDIIYAERYIMDMASKWERGTVLVNRDIPPHIDDDDSGWTKVDDNIYVSTGSDTSWQSEIVMGGVIYRYGDKWGHNVGLKTCTFIPIDSDWTVNFTPSRENLHMTDKTKEVIADIAYHAPIYWDRYLETCLDGLSDWEMTEFYWKIPRRKEYQPRSWRKLGFERNTLFTTGGPAWYFHSDDSVTKGATSVQKEWITGDDILVTGFPYKRLSKVHKLSLRAHGVEGHAIFIPEEWSNNFDIDSIPKDRHVRWGDVKRVKVERAKTASGERSETRYDIWQLGGWTTANVEELEESDNKIVVCVGTKDDKRTFVENAKKIPNRENLTFVFITSRQEDKFKRLFPDTERFGDIYQREKQKAWAALSRDDKLWKYAGHDFKQLSKKLKMYEDKLPTKFKARLLPDPNTEAIFAYENFGDRGLMSGEANSFAAAAKRRYTDIIKDYPLLELVDRYYIRDAMLDEVVEYVVWKSS